MSSIAKNMRIALVILALGSCSALPEFSYEENSITTDSHFSPPKTLAEQTQMNAQEKSITAKHGWWLVYKNDDLNLLMEDAFKGSPTIAQIRARLVQAKANEQKTASALFPTLNVSGDRASQNGDNRQPSEFNLGGAASFELDIWGKYHADSKASDYATQAAAEDLHAGIITLSAQLVENWLQLLALRQQQALLEKQIDVNRSVLSLLEKRYEMGVSTALSLLQQKETLAQSESLLPDLLSAQETTLNQIAYLSGKNPSSTLIIKDNMPPQTPPLPDAGLPSFLLANRPDIAASWMRLQSAKWLSQVATLDRLPSFDLSARYATSAAMLDGLFNTWLLDLAAGFALPVIDGGNRRAEELRSEAYADEQFASYREIVLNAVREVENALSENTYQDQKIATLENQLTIARATLEQAQLTYSNGNSDYINVLRSITSVQALERQIVEAQFELSRDRVALYRALGGRSWARRIAQTDINDKGENL